MSRLLEKLSNVLTTLEREGTPAEKAQAGTLVRSFLQRQPIDTLDHDGQTRTLFEATARRDRAMLQKLTHSPFADVSRAAEATLRETFGEA